MAEIVGLVSAITALVGAGCKIARTISDLADELGTVGQQLKSLAVETKALTWILQTLQAKISSQTRAALSQEAILLAQDIIALCQMDMEGINEFLLPFGSLKDESKRSFFQRARWTFAKSKITSRQASLDSLKLSLTLFLHTLELGSGLGDGDLLQEEVQHILAKPTNTKMAFFRAEEADVLLEEELRPSRDRSTPRLPPPSQTEQGIATVASPLRIVKANQSEVEGQLEVSQLCQDITLTSGSNTIDNALLGDDGRKAEHQRSGHDLSMVVGIMTDDQFLWIAEHVRVQRSVTRYAFVTLSKQNQEEALLSAGVDGAELKPQIPEQQEKQQQPRAGKVDKESDTAKLEGPDQSESKTPPRPPLHAYVESDASECDEQATSNKEAEKEGKKEAKKGGIAGRRMRSRPKARRHKAPPSPTPSSPMYFDSVEEDQLGFSHSRAAAASPDHAWHSPMPNHTHHPMGQFPAEYYGPWRTQQSMPNPFLPKMQMPSLADFGNQEGQHRGYHYPSWPSPPTGAGSPSPPPPPDPEKEALKARLQAIEEAREKVRMERIAREDIEAEYRAERKVREENAIASAERNAREKLEAEMKAKEALKKGRGIRRIFSIT